MWKDGTIQHSLFIEGVFFGPNSAVRSYDFAPTPLETKTIDCLTLEIASRRR